MSSFLVTMISRSPNYDIFSCDFEIVTSAITVGYESHNYKIRSPMSFFFSECNVI